MNTKKLIFPLVAVFAFAVAANAQFLTPEQKAKKAQAEENDRIMQKYFKGALEKRAAQEAAKTPQERSLEEFERKLEETKNKQEAEANRKAAAKKNKSDFDAAVEKAEQEIEQLKKNYPSQIERYDNLIKAKNYKKIKEEIAKGSAKYSADRYYLLKGVAEQNGTEVTSFDTLEVAQTIINLNDASVKTADYLTARKYEKDILGKNTK